MTPDTTRSSKWVAAIRALTEMFMLVRDGLSVPRDTILGVDRMPSSHSFTHEIFLSEA
jgi:hypothetical protein